MSIHTVDALQPDEPANNTSNDSAPTSVITLLVRLAYYFLCCSSLMKGTSVKGRDETQNE